MTPNLHALIADDRAQALGSRARTERRAVAAAAARRDARLAAAGEALIRRADERDCLAIDRLEQLEGRRLGLGPLLVAEVEGEVLAALPLSGGAGVADPFRKTARLVERLERTREGAVAQGTRTRPSLASLRWRRRSSSSTVI